MRWKLTIWSEQKCKVLYVIIYSKTKHNYSSPSWLCTWNQERNAIYCNSCKIQLSQQYMYSTLKIVIKQTLLDQALVSNNLKWQNCKESVKSKIFPSIQHSIQDFHITNFPFLRSNVPSSPAYGVFITQLIQYARASSSYECLILRAVRITNMLLGMVYVNQRWRSSLRKFYGRYGDLIKQ